MNGRIITYCKDVSAGVVENTEGRKYLFNFTSWLSGPNRPVPNTEVTFNVARSWALDVRVALVPPLAAAQALRLPWASDIALAG